MQILKAPKIFMIFSYHNLYCKVPQEKDGAWAEKQKSSNVLM